MNPYVTPATIASKNASWLERIDLFNQHKMSLNQEKSALLVIDMQKFFLDPDSPTYTCGGLAILPNVKRLIEVFRKNNRPVIYTKHVHHPDHLDDPLLSEDVHRDCAGAYHVVAEGPDD